MTFCLALTVPGISLVVADTRVNLTHVGDFHTHQDGPEDLVISVTNPKYETVIPFRFRKIRRVSDGWVTSAGNYLLGKSVLDLLCEQATDCFTPANQLLQSQGSRLKEDIQKQTGFTDSELAGTVIMGAPFGLQPAVWVISFDPDRVKTNHAIGDYSANWPQLVPVDVRHRAQAEFEREFQLALSAGSIAGLVKASVRMVEEASKYATDVGPYVQIGITVDSSMGKKSYYLQGRSAELLSISDTNLMKRLELLV